MSMQYARRWSSMLTLALATTSTAAFAQNAATTWPSKPITIVRITAPGSAADAEVRLWADKLAASLGKSVVIDYKTGASGIIGTSYVAKSAPDGYTLLSATTSFTVAPAFNSDLPYNVVKDFAALSMMSSASIVLLGAPNFPPNNFAEFVAYAKANPGKISWTTSGVGTVNHLSGALLSSEIKADITFVHYKGGAPQIYPDLMAGRVHVYPSSLQNAVPLIKAGKFKAIVLLSRNRSSLLPDLKTVQEQGIADYDYPNYSGFVTAAGTNAAIVERLGAEFGRIARDPEVVKKLESVGNVMIGSTPAEFSRYIATEVARWTKVVKERNIKAE